MPNPNLPVKFLPHNPQEFENDMRALIVSHMGLGQGNPTQWVVNAVVEAYQRGFSDGYLTGAKSMAKTAAENSDPDWVDVPTRNFSGGASGAAPPTKSSRVDGVDIDAVHRKQMLRFTNAGPVTLRGAPPPLVERVDDDA